MRNILSASLFAYVYGNGKKKLRVIIQYFEQTQTDHKF